MHVLNRSYERVIHELVPALKTVFTRKILQNSEGSLREYPKVAFPSLPTSYGREWEIVTAGDSAGVMSSRG